MMAVVTLLAVLAPVALGLTVLLVRSRRAWRRVHVVDFPAVRFPDDTNPPKGAA